MTTTKSVDVEPRDCGSFITLTPTTGAALAWLQENCPESTWLGESLVCERRYVADLVDGLRAAGFHVIDPTCAHDEISDFDNEDARR